MYKEMDSLSRHEKKILDHARKKILVHAKKRRDAGLYDVLYSFVLSENNNIYWGVPLESNVGNLGTCAERVAIANMVANETENARIKTILVASPAPDRKTQPATPCGACRHVIMEHATPDTTVLCATFIRTQEGWDIFPVTKKYAIEQLYPEGYEPIEW